MTTWIARQMSASRAVFIAILACAASPAAAATLDDIAAAMGSGKLNNVQYTGSGWHHLIGQSMRAGGEWPRFPLTRVARTLDYANAAMTEDYTYVQGDGPIRGGGAQPFVGDVRRVVGIGGDAAWSVAGQNNVSAPGQVAGLQHELWISAHGMVKAAMQDKAAAMSGPAGTSFAIERAGKFKARAQANRDNLIERVESVSFNPVLGDMVTVTLYSDYKDFGGVKFPTRIIQTVQGSTSLDVTLSDVKINAGGVTAPAQLQAPAPAPGATIEKVADGIYFVGGASHNSLAIEMADHVILVEAPLGDARTVEVIELIRKTIPGKPLRTVINTHHHFDHSGGLRAAIAEGLTVVTSELNQAYFEAAYAAPHAIAPDRMARGNAAAKFQTVGDKLVISDATRTIELHTLRDHGHVDGMLIGYLPKEKILFVADAFSPRSPTPITKAPAQLHPATVNLMDNVKRLGLNIDTVLPMHGRVATMSELTAEAGL